MPVDVAQDADLEVAERDSRELAGIPPFAALKGRRTVGGGELTWHATHGTHKEHNGRTGTDHQEVVDDVGPEEGVVARVEEGVQHQELDDDVAQVEDLDEDVDRRHVGPVELA